MKTGREGEDHWAAKLAENQVLEIRRRHEEGESQASLAREFKVTRSTINKIIKRKLWKD